MAPIPLEVSPVDEVEPSKQPIVSIVAHVPSDSTPQWLHLSAVIKNSTLLGYEAKKQINQTIKQHPETGVPDIVVDKADAAAAPLSSTQALPPVDVVDHAAALEIEASVTEPTGEGPSGACKLRKMLTDTDELIVCPGVYDGLSARAALEVGFNAMYMVSSLSI